jgi:protocatechuate 3,4-dioxygenase beta subunit
MIMSLDRRGFFREGMFGLAAAGAGAMLLPEAARATEPSGELGKFAPYAARAPRTTPAAFLAANQPGLVIPPAAPPANFAPTEDNILGPYHRKGAPFRAKITPPFEPGEAMVIRGRVWAADTRRPLAGAVLDVWQASAKGRYDNDDQANPPAAGLFLYRARIMADETGYYEYETIKPGRYQIGANLWRPAHIHYWIVATGYKPLVTQLYFKGDPYNDKDDFIKPSLIIEPTPVTINGQQVAVGTFDIVLNKA